MLCCLYGLRGGIPCLAGASIAVVLNVDVDGVLEVAAELLRLLLGQSVPRDHWRGGQIMPATLGGTGTILPSKACSTLIASFALVSK